jgi:hypothetical protein
MMVIDSNTTHWHQQSSDKPLFPDLLWSRPERRAQSGKLLIIGGNRFGLVAPAQAYSDSQKAGIGEVRVILPDILKRTIGRTFPAGQFAPSTPSGGFSQRALEEIMASSNWADGVLLSGDLGRNSETAILLEQFVAKYSGQLTAADDAVDYFINTPEAVIKRPNTTLILNLAQLQKLAIKMTLTTAFTSDMDLLRLVNALHELSALYPINIVTKHLGQLVVAVDGEVSSTKLVTDQDSWSVMTASYLAVWWLQNQTQTFAALSCAIYSMVYA